MPNILLALQLIEQLIADIQAVIGAIKDANASGKDITADTLTKLQP